MRRLLPLALANALAVSSVTAAPLHVHRYSGHDHAEHHHGPASHEHPITPLTERHPADGGDDHHPAIRIAPCDPGRHAVAFWIGCATVSRVDVVAAEPADGTPIAWTAPIRSRVSIGDVRVHGPPASARIPSRAPPLTAHA